LNIKVIRFANKLREVNRWPTPATSLTGIFLIAVFTFGDRTARAEPTLREWAQQRGFYIGAAVSIPHLDEPEYQHTLRSEFNICVPENAGKMDPFSMRRIAPSPLIRPCRTCSDIRRNASFATDDARRLTPGQIVVERPAAWVAPPREGTRV